MIQFDNICWLEDPTCSGAVWRHDTVYWVVMQVWQVDTEHWTLPQSQDGWSSEWSRANWEQTESPPGIQTDSPRQCFANQVWTVQRTTDLRLRQELHIVRNSMARLEVKSFVTKCLKTFGFNNRMKFEVVGIVKKETKSNSSNFLEFFNLLAALNSYGI